MKLSQTLAAINAELRRRHFAGRSTDVVDLDAEPLLDDKVGVFMRNTLHFADGDVVVIDSMEMCPEMRKALQVRAMQ